MKSIFAFYRLVRGNNLLIVIALQYILRYALLLPILEKYGISPVLSDLKFGMLVFATAILAASGYVINDYFDLNIDRINRPKRVIVGKYLHRRTALFLHVLFTSLGVLAGLYLAYIYRKEQYVLLFLLMPILLWFYSTTFKRQILIGNVMVAAFTALVPYLVVSLEFTALASIYGGKIYDSEAAATGWFWTIGFAFFAFLTTLFREIIKDMEDVQGDKHQGCKTLPIVLGVNYAKVIALLLISATIMAIAVLYYTVPELSRNVKVFYYLMGGLITPLIFLFGYLIFAKTTSQYRFAGTISKIIMLLGIMLIVIAGKLI